MLHGDAIQRLLRIRVGYAMLPPEERRRKIGEFARYRGLTELCRQGHGVWQLEFGPRYALEECPPIGMHATDVP